MDSIPVLTFELTYECSLRCTSCHVADFAKPPAGAVPMTNAERLRIVHECLDHGLRQLRILGGEPLLSEDLIPLLRERPSGLPVQVVSNGLHLSRGMIADLLDAGLDALVVSLDGLSEAHDQVRGPGSWRQAWEGLERAAGEIRRRPGCRTRLMVNFCFHRGNEHDLGELRQRVNHLGAAFFAHPALEMDDPSLQSSLDGEPVNRVRASIPDGHAPYTARELRIRRRRLREFNLSTGVSGSHPGWQIRLLHLLETGWDALRRVRSFPCDRARANLLFDPWGRAFPCEFAYGYLYGHAGEGAAVLWGGERRRRFLAASNKGELPCCRSCNRAGVYRDLVPRLKALLAR